jgi:leucyl-tRNA synthetase
MVLGSNGVKMSKSLGNVVDPRDVVKEYGADSLRIWEAFMGDYAASVNWNDDGVKSCNKLLNRIWNLQEILVDGKEISKELEYSFNFAIKKVSSDIDNVKFNTAISSIMILVNDIYKVGRINREEYKNLILIISPFAPHISEELYTKLGFGKSISESSWPKYDESKLERDEVEVPIQVNGKLRGVVAVNKNAKQDEILELAKNEPEILKYLTGDIKKVIYIPGKIFNVVV